MKLLPDDAKARARNLFAAIENLPQRKSDMSLFKWVSVTLALCFLFVGEPDVWDKLHEKAMKNLSSENLK